jgi:hypothetical protein
LNNAYEPYPSPFQHSSTTPDNDYPFNQASPSSTIIPQQPSIQLQSPTQKRKSSNRLIENMEGRPSKHTKNINQKLKKPWVALTAHESLIRNSSNSISNDPKSYKEAMESPHTQEWKQAINTEFNSTK